MTKIVTGLIRVTTGGKKDNKAEVRMDCATCCNRYIGVTCSRSGQCWNFLVPFCFRFRYEGKTLMGVEKAVCSRHGEPFDVQEEIAELEETGGLGY